MSLPMPCRSVVTELAIGSDGTIYLNAEGYDRREFVGRQPFLGFALTRHEVKRMGPRGIHIWAATSMTMIAWGSDGRVYVDDDALAYTSGRKRFHGFALSAFEVACLLCTLHMAANGIVIDAFDMMRERGRAV